MNTEIDSSTLSLRIAVVGHTNTGKTSLLRTLTRNRKFGQVQASPGTTRRGEGVHSDLAPLGQLLLYDTPGIEDSMALLDYIERLVEADQRVEGPERIRRFLDSPEAQGRFEQEARVLTQLMHSEAALYVIDVRRSEEHTSELQSRGHLVCRLLLEKKKTVKVQDDSHS